MVGQPGSNGDDENDLDDDLDDENPPGLGTNGTGDEIGDLLVQQILSKKSPPSSSTVADLFGRVRSGSLQQNNGQRSSSQQNQQQQKQQQQQQKQSFNNYEDSNFSADYDDDDDDDDGGDVEKDIVDELDVNTGKITNEIRHISSKNSLYPVDIKSGKSMAMNLRQFFCYFILTKTQIF